MTFNAESVRARFGFTGDGEGVGAGGGVSIQEERSRVRRVVKRERVFVRVGFMSISQPSLYAAIGRISDD